MWIFFKGFLKPMKSIWFSWKSANRRDCERHGAKDSSLLLNWCPRIPSQVPNLVNVSQAGLLGSCKDLRHLIQPELWFPALWLSCNFYSACVGANWNRCWNYFSQIVVGHSSALIETKLSLYELRPAFRGGGGGRGEAFLGLKYNPFLPIVNSKYNQCQ